ncbi:inner nuclear membrane protein enriched at telomere/subtelomere region [Collariella sp. IMI 366227]|nr:inner nuclear membrane protein enriched at telomere/subtelomere region [Collariella sp. IMI 366227]
MSDTESVDYLQEDFDPRSLTVPRLRSILVTHNIHYPSQAKKPQLIDLFNEHVLPQSRQILATRARAKRSSRGIVDADSQSTASTDFDGEAMPPPPSVRRSRSPRKVTRVKRESEEPAHAPRTPAALRESPRKRQSRSTSAQLPSDNEAAPEPEQYWSVRTDRRTTPVPKLEPPEEDNFFKRTPQTAHVFTKDNPFQSGANSPASPFKTPTNRRKTAGLESVLRQTPSTARRRTDVHTFDEIEEPSTVSRTFEVPMNRVLRSHTPEMEPDEEFTPEEQLALEQESAAHPELVMARRAQPVAKRSSTLATPIWLLVTTLAIAYAAWYRQEKIAVGYCGLGREPTQLIPTSIQLPEWAAEFGSKFDIQSIQFPDWLTTAFEPQCEPCPPHAYCYEDFTARCEPDFILKSHLLSLGGLVPVPPTCEPDGEKVRRVQAVADRAVEELRDRRAKYECGEPLEPEGEPLDSPSIDAEELKEILSKKRSRRMAADEFDELWAAAIGEIKARDEVEVQTEEFEEAYDIGGLILTLFTILHARRRFLRNRALAAQIPGLVDQVLERLAAQKEVAFDAADESEDAFLFLPNLRDDVLRSLHSLKERDALWQRVRAVVEQNSNPHNLLNFLVSHAATRHPIPPRNMHTAIAFGPVAAAPTPPLFFPGSSTVKIALLSTVLKNWGIVT